MYKKLQYYHTLEIVFLVFKRLRRWVRLDFDAAFGVRRHFEQLVKIKRE
jgi:hypothetical protein